MLKIVLVGIGGYGENYVQILLDEVEASKRFGTHPKINQYPFQVVGAVDPFPDRSRQIERLRQHQIPVYLTLEQFYEASDADLAIISSPIQFHCPQTCLALSQGSHVLCEKPISATVEEAKQMMKARDQANRIVAMGYQLSYSKAIQALKQDVMSGVLGKPIRMKTIVLWPRTDRYYARGWAGRKTDDQGRMILDSVANNATAHYIHNLFYLLGSEMGKSAEPAKLTAELYRANRIENYDTAAMRAITKEGVELLYYGSHAVKQQSGPHFCLDFEHAQVRYDHNSESKSYIAHFHHGERKEYHDTSARDLEKLESLFAAIHGEGPVICGLEAAFSHTLCIHGMQRSCEEIISFPEEIVRRGEVFPNNDTGNYVEGLYEQLYACYEQAILPAEAGLNWARAGEKISISIG